MRSASRARREITDSEVSVAFWYRRAQTKHCCNLWLDCNMTVCVAYGCSNRTDRKPKGVTFHAFPKDPETRKAWIMAVRRANWMPSRASMLCSEHFTEDVIDRSSKFSVRIQKGALPTVFKGFPKELQEKLRKNPPPKFVLSKIKMLSKKTDPVPKDINPPKYLNPASNNAPTKICDMSLEIQRQIDVKELNNNLEEKMKLKKLLKREQKFIIRINSLKEKIEEQRIQIQNMHEFTATLKNEHYRRFKEIQDYKQAS